MQYKKNLFSCLVFGAGTLGSGASAQADIITFELDNVFYDSGHQMTGQFDWTFTPGDFEDGLGVFTSLDVPRTAHGLPDLIITIEPSMIEISLAGSFHDDGVDVSLVLVEPFSPSGPAALNLDPAESKYSIGGNGFIDGGFIAGRITPVPEPMSLSLLGIAALWGIYPRRSRSV